MNDRSPFASPSPVVVLRQPPDERGQLLRGEDGEASGMDDNNHDNADSNNDEEDVDSDNEDGLRDETPLLPIFSAAHLGSRAALSIPCHYSCADRQNRCFAHIQPHSCYSFTCYV
jgi:hypothetical protein